MSLFGLLIDSLDMFCVYVCIISLSDVMIRRLKSRSAVSVGCCVFVFPVGLFGYVWNPISR